MEAHTAQDIMTFEDAIEIANKKSRFKKTHLFLGNGFSIACKKDIFTYQALYDSANFEDYPEIRDLFETLGTTDFEEVIRALSSTSKISSAYGLSEDAFSEKIVEHADALYP